MQAPLLRELALHFYDIQPAFVSFFFFSLPFIASMARSPPSQLAQKLDFKTSLRLCFQRSACRRVKRPSPARIDHVCGVVIIALGANPSVRKSAPSDALDLCMESGGNGAGGLMVMGWGGVMARAFAVAAALLAPLGISKW